MDNLLHWHRTIYINPIRDLRSSLLNIKTVFIILLSVFGRAHSAKEGYKFKDKSGALLHIDPLSDSE
jgi:hypothetical protein